MRMRLLTLTLTLTLTLLLMLMLMFSFCETLAEHSVDHCRRSLLRRRHEREHLYGNGAILCRGARAQAPELFKRHLHLHLPSDRPDAGT